MLRNKICPLATFPGGMGRMPRISLAMTLLPRTRLPHDSHDFTLVDIQGSPVEDLQRAVDV